ncbi:hypothetical protein AMTRI_Chr02g264440 [Amborella trichopoda]
MAPTFLSFLCPFSLYFLLTIALVHSLSYLVFSWLLTPGGPAWAGKPIGKRRIPGPRGLPVLGSLVQLSYGLSHHKLAEMAAHYNAKKLMALSLGTSPLVVTSDPDVAHELLSSAFFADRPLKQAAHHMMFDRAIGFAPSGPYWRLLRKVSWTHLFSQRSIKAQAQARKLGVQRLMSNIMHEARIEASVCLRKHLQEAAFYDIMHCVFGDRVEVDSKEALELREMVEEGYELLGRFDWCDHLPWLRPMDPLRIRHRSQGLSSRVREWIGRVVKRCTIEVDVESENPGFVHVLLSLSREEKLGDEDVIAVIWELFFRGTDTSALLAEWATAEIILNPHVQSTLQSELDLVVGPTRGVHHDDLPHLKYLQSIIKETLRVHPPGPLLSWARLCTQDTELRSGLLVPKGSMAMVNMWAIMRDPHMWDLPERFEPKRFLTEISGRVMDVKGSDTRVAPFGAGRRVCPGREVAMESVSLWVGEMFRRFEWGECVDHPIELGEVMRLSSEMRTPLRAVPMVRV